MSHNTFMLLMFVFGFRLIFLNFWVRFGQNIEWCSKRSYLIPSKVLEDYQIVHFYCAKPQILGVRVFHLSFVHFRAVRVSGERDKEFT